VKVQLLGMGFHKTHVLVENERTHWAGGCVGPRAGLEAALSAHAGNQTPAIRPLV
jgi:hypothetical protein